MPKKKKGDKQSESRKKVHQHPITIKSKSYGALRGTKIYFEGKRPKQLKKDGSINFGKAMLETLGRVFKRFRWIITEKTNSITTERGIVRVRTSQTLMGRMYNEQFDRTRDIKNDIVRSFLSSTFPEYFSSTSSPVYVPGTIAGMINPEITTKLSSEDKEAINTFLPSYLASEAVGQVQKLKASAQIKSLKSLAEHFENELSSHHAESHWQKFIESNILLMQQGYIKALQKLNVSIGVTKFPDFCLVTHDNYLDILEIKRPDTKLLKSDDSRNNYYFDPEISKAIIQTENYIESINNRQADISQYLRENERIEVKAIRPRGIILAGNAGLFTEQKQRDDFRLLTQGLKNISILTYDELLTRLKNYINVLEAFSK